MVFLFGAGGRIPGVKWGRWPNIAWTKVILGTPGSVVLDQVLGPYLHLTLTDTTAQLLLNPGAITFPLLTDTVALIAASQTLTNKVLTAPTLGGTVIGTYAMGGTMTIAQPFLADADATRDLGSPSVGWRRAYLRGTGGAIRYDDTTIMGLTQKVGSGAGDYPGSINGTYQDVDTTNLSFTVTVPVGWKLSVVAKGTCVANASGNGAGMAINDSQNGKLDAAAVGNGVNGMGSNFCMTGLIAGDNLPHTVRLQSYGNNGLGAWTIVNSALANFTDGAAKILPKMTFLLMPSN